MIQHRRRSPTLAHEPLQPHGVDIVLTQGKSVPGSRPGHRPTSEEPTQLRDLSLQRVRRVSRRVVSPQLVDETVIGDTSRHGQLRQRQQRLALSPRH